MYENGVWKPGKVPIAVIMISLNEGHNLNDVCENLSGWAHEVFLVDSYSKDETIDIALNYGIRVVQRRFRGFGDQWNFALNELDIKSPWVMKLDPDERLTDELKINISNVISENQYDAFSLKRRLWFMGKSLSIHQKLIRVWRSGVCRFSDVDVNEYPIIDGNVGHVKGDLEHRDSPNLDHWLEKQNRYSTLEAEIAYKNKPLSDEQIFFGTSLQRRMWLKRNFYKVPFRYFFLFVYHYLFQGAIRSGRVGYIWARLRLEVMRLVEYKQFEMKILNKTPTKRFYGPGKPDNRVKNFN
jgi:glycosyltransferase involved in cell wall biosynthesis